MTRPQAAALALVDGSMFEGEIFGAAPGDRPASGEVVFNTALTGYQEIITDPSYAGQIISFTYPHIGNYGVNPDDDESRGAFARGVIVRDLARRHSNQRATGALESFLERHGLSGIGGLDTRRLTRIIRDAGALCGAFGPIEGEGAFDEATLKAAAAAEPGTGGIDLVSQVTTPEPYRVAAWGPAADGGTPRRSIVALDFGIKRRIVHHLSAYGDVDVLPASADADEILARSPDGVFLSNGPGDPEVNEGAIATVGALIGHVPIFGICLGHQLLSLAAGGSTVKLPFGHHGGNHPVRDVVTGAVEITAQNHNFAVDADSVADVADLTHVNLNDGVCEGIALREAPAFGVQHHPEASPGPHDSLYLFDRFADLMDGRSARTQGDNH